MTTTTTTPARVRDLNTRVWDEGVVSTWHVVMVRPGTCTSRSAGAPNAGAVRRIPERRWHQHPANARDQKAPVVVTKQPLGVFYVIFLGRGLFRRKAASRGGCFAGHGDNGAEDEEQRKERRKGTKSHFAAADDDDDDGC